MRGESMSRYDIILGHWAFYNHWFTEYKDPFYTRLRRISRYFNPRRGWNWASFFDDKRGEYTAARIVYDNLCKKYGVEA